MFEAVRYLDVLRHGAVTGNECLRGEQDDPLSALGWEQMQQATATATGWTQIVSSPLRRCAEFAQTLANARGVPLHVVAEWRERSFGDWEGRSLAALPEAELAQFWADPVGYTPPSAEPFTAFRERVLAAWLDLCADQAQHTLLITHGGVIRVLVAEVLCMADAGLLALEVPHACLTRLRIYPPPGRASLIGHG
ncbi:alpha-ribazole phosphatase [Allochromatium warmingii]|uniref:Alpha-ribazole phosphatase n=1 Tax=Allochromatium warmingii TaxID=61595 RepID=A0A1H3CIH7_ALLWA|nr:histidine phosphatase family protein [Allochromatium warmingii]SDX53925.1 alpha-ribazole phosphatase [Allochromatium warmingii]